MNHFNGPLINKTSSTFTTRDSLGIEGATNSISANLCPVVNTVTPRPYYWAFLTWAYWKFYEHFHYIKDSEARDFIKRVNYFIAMGSRLAGNYVMKTISTGSLKKCGRTRDGLKCILKRQL